MTLLLTSLYMSNVKDEFFSYFLYVTERSTAPWIIVNTVVSLLLFFGLQLYFFTRGCSTETQSHRIN